MKRWFILAAAVALLSATAFAAEIPRELERAAPEAAGKILQQDMSGAGAFSAGITAILSFMARESTAVFRSCVKGAAQVLGVAVICSAVECFAEGGGGRSAMFLPPAGGLAVTALTAGSLDELIGLGRHTISQLNDFSKVLLPALAAATAAGGAAATATTQQVASVFLVSILIAVIDGVLIPLAYIYIALLAAGSCLQEKRLTAIAVGMKKIITWMLTTAVLLFTLYLSAARVLSGSVDAAAVKVTKAAISGVIPVVGGIIAEVSESVLAGAGLLKGTIGVFGTLAVLAACAVPFLRLGIRYLLYKLAAFLCGAIGADWLCQLVDGLGGAFGLILGMTGSCAVLLVVSVLSFAAAVSP